MQKSLTFSALVVALAASFTAHAHEDHRLEAWLAKSPATETRPYEQSQVEAQLGNLWVSLDDAARAEKLFARARVNAAAVREPYVRETLKGHLANEVASAGDYDAALAKLGEIRDTEVRVKTAWKLIAKLAKSKQDARARSVLEDTVKASFSVADPLLRAELVSGSGASFRYVDRARGENLVYEAHGMAQMLSDPYERAIMFNESAAHLVDIGHRERAIEVFDEVDQLVGQIDDPLKQAKALAMLGGEQAEKNLRERAVGALDRGRKIAEALPESEERSAVLSEIARNYGQSHRFEPGIATATAIKDPYHRVEGYIRIAKNMARTGKADEARALLDRAEADTMLVKNGHARAIVLRKIASEHIDLGTKAHARKLLELAEAAIVRADA